MFTVSAASELATFVEGEEWTFIGCASFEPRWCGFADLARNAVSPPVQTLVLYPEDNGSAFRNECEQAQHSNWNNSHLVNDWHAKRLDIELLGPSPWRFVRDGLEAFASDPGMSRRLIIDVTTMPRVCIFSAVEWALRNDALDDLALVYTEPGGYGSDTLHSEPTGPFIVPPFDFLPPLTSGAVEVSWIPILGFGPTFAKSIHETIASEYDLGHNIYPLVGFPAFDRGFFDRCLADCAPIFEGRGITSSQFVYASAADPFETRDAILRSIDSAPPSHAWIGSPMGPKPMTIGMLLAAIDRQLTIIIDQARTYNPKYSLGTGPVHMYVLRHHGRRTY